LHIINYFPIKLAESSITLLNSKVNPLNYCSLYYHFIIITTLAITIAMVIIMVVVAIKGRLTKESIINLYSKDYWLILATVINHYFRQLNLH